MLVLASADFAAELNVSTSLPSLLLKIYGGHTGLARLRDVDHCDDWGLVEVYVVSNNRVSAGGEWLMLVVLVGHGPDGGLYCGVNFVAGSKILAPHLAPAFRQGTPPLAARDSHASGSKSYLMYTGIASILSHFSLSPSPVHASTSRLLHSPCAGAQLLLLR